MRITVGELRRIIREAMSVEYVIGPSRIKSAGEGLYSVNSVKSGEVVFRWDPEVDVEGDVEEDGWDVRLSSVEGGRWYRAGGGGAYFNHSDDPNVGIVDGDGPKAKRDRVALRDISSGEEMTMDYRSIGDDW